MLKQNNIIEALAAQVKVANAQVAALTVQLALLAAASATHGGDHNKNLLGGGESKHQEKGWECALCLGSAHSILKSSFNVI